MSYRWRRRFWSQRVKTWLWAIVKVNLFLLHQSLQILLLLRFNLVLADGLRQCCLACVDVEYRCTFGTQRPSWRYRICMSYLTRKAVLKLLTTNKLLGWRCKLTVVCFTHGFNSKISQLFWTCRPAVVNTLRAHHLLLNLAGLGTGGIHSVGFYYYMLFAIFDVNCL
jgi:hypothetical protein